MDSRNLKDSKETAKKPATVREYLSAATVDLLDIDDFYSIAYRQWQTDSPTHELGPYLLNLMLNSLSSNTTLVEFSCNLEIVKNKFQFKNSQALELCLCLTRHPTLQKLTLVNFPDNQVMAKLFWKG